MDKKAKILLIEDDADLRGTYKEFLSEVYAVETADNGEDGFTKACTKPFDLILLDLVMPKLDGIGFLERKKQTPSLTDARVIVMSNAGEEEIVKKCFDLGVRYFILKAETTPDKILEVVAEALR